MRLIQHLKFRTLKTEFFKIPHLQTPRLQMVIFQMGITVASGPCCSDQSFTNSNLQRTPIEKDTLKDRRLVVSWVDSENNIFMGLLVERVQITLTRGTHDSPSSSSFYVCQ